MEQTKKTTPTNISDKESKDSFGKFNKLEDLVQAYNSLESEFTKRSQKLKEYEEKHHQQELWENKVNKFIDKYPIASELTEEIGEEIANKNMIDDEDCLEKALLSVLSARYKSPKEQAKDTVVIDEVLKDETLKEQIIEEYRKKFDFNLPKTLPKGGEIPIKTPIRPSTINDAGKMALELLKEE